MTGLPKKQNKKKQELKDISSDARNGIFTVFKPSRFLNRYTIDAFSAECNLLH